MGIFSKFKSGFKRGADALQGALSRVSGRAILDEEDLMVLEEALFAGDFGVESTEEIISEIRDAYQKNKSLRGEQINNLARDVLRKILAGSEGIILNESQNNPEVICLIGVNGSGKTTTCAKLGIRFKKEGSVPLLAACDTFRAAATEQLLNWADRLDLQIVSGHHGSDSAAVAYDSYSACESRGCDRLLIDTAGRLHVKDNLMDELYKLKRVLQKRNPTAPHHSWLVIDGSTGSNVVEQARVFHEKFGLTGLVVTKLDGTSKGGALVSIYRKMKLPIYFIGLGEGADDLQPFSIEYYLDSIFPSAEIEANVN
jgi:fused signal recognition particle receptor